MLEKDADMREELKQLVRGKLQILDDSFSILGLLSYQMLIS